MIGKVPKAGRGFRGLVSYLLKGAPDDPEGAARVAWTETHNLISEDPNHAPALMRMTAAKSNRVKKPVYHFVVSWHHNEAPSDDLMRDVADATCEDLGLAEYQRCYIAHHDTKHRHVHIVVNRVHPETGVAWKTSHDYRRIEQSLARQAESHGLEIVPGRFNERLAPAPTKPRRVRDGELQKSKREGGPLPVPRWSREQIAERRHQLSTIFDAAQRWDELHEQLAAVGLTAERKGAGMVIADATGEMKLSELGKRYRLAGLEQRFARPFEPRAADKPPAKDDDKGAGERLAALRDANQATDYGFAFYRLGLITREQLEKTLQEKARAEEAQLADRPLMDQLLHGMGKAERTKPSSPDRGLKPQGKKKRRSRDRGR